MLRGGRFRWAAPVAVAVVGALVVWAALTRSADEAGPSRRALVVVDPTRPGRAIPRSFVGIATEWDSVGAYAGPAGRRRTALVALLRQVGRAQRSPVALRIGGDSADQSWWNPRGRPRPPTVLHDLGPRSLDDAAWLARGLGGPVTLGLNLALGDAPNTIMVARQLRRRLGTGQLAAVELGNEPDFYGRERRWRVDGYVHVRLRKRARGYSPADYGREAARLLAAVRQAPVLDRHVAVVGAGFATPAWWPALAVLLRTGRLRPDVLAAHLYGFASCAGPTPSADWLMAPERSHDAAARLAPLARIAARAGLPWRVTEMNSAPCGGRRGLSDTPAAAVWLADTLFALAAEGARQVDVQTWNHARYAVVALTRGGALPRPPLDGMLAFAHAAPAGSRLVPATVRGGDEVRAWATVDRRGATRVLVVAPRGGDVRVRVRGASCGAAWLATPAEHVRLRSRRVGDACRLLVPAQSLAVLVLPPPKR